MRVGKAVVQIGWEAFVVVFAQGVAPDWIGQALAIVTGGPLA